MKQDTVRLMRECSEGIEMGLEAIDRVLPLVHAPDFRQSLLHCRHRHRELGREIIMRLDAEGIAKKRLHPMAAWMAGMHIACRIRLHPTDASAAKLITGGCNMGIASLSRLLNQYPNASEAARNLTKALIESEEQLAQTCRAWL